MPSHVRRKTIGRKLMKAAKDGKVARKGLLQDRLQQALDAGVLTEQEVERSLLLTNFVTKLFK